MKRAWQAVMPPLICLAVFWRVPFVWFRTDDFAWLILPQRVHGIASLLRILFHPEAQGTVRVLSDRLFFLILSSIFGVWSGPFRLCTLATWFAALTLANLVGVKLTGSRLAGTAAAILWTTSYVVVTPLAWASAYNQILCAFLMLAALYARIRWLESGARRWLAAEWIAYLLGFGALEVTVMYPVVALLYTWCVARRKDKTAFAMLLPAATFAGLHLFLIPRATEGVYQVTLDARFPSTLLSYVKLVLGPDRFPLRAILGVLLAGFLVWRLWLRDWAVLFCPGWFALFLAPVLLLPNNISIYYLTIPSLGLAWLIAWGLALAWAANRLARVASIIAAVLFLAGSLPEINTGTAWWLDRTSRMRSLFRGVEQAAEQHPATVLILKDVNNALFQTGFQDHPFRLAGIDQVYLAPGSDTGIVAREDLGGLSPFRISMRDCMHLIETDRARVLEVTSGAPRDITERFEAALATIAPHYSFVDVGDPYDASRVGPGWYPAENGFRWMARSATVQLAGPVTSTESLYVTGYGPASAFANGPVTLCFRVGGFDVGSGRVIRPNEKFAFRFELPAQLLNQSRMEVSVESDKVFHTAADPRDLGIVFGTFSVR